MVIAATLGVRIVSKTLGIIGCGKMAYAIVKGLNKLSDKQFSNIYINDIDSNRIKIFVDEFGSKLVPPEELVNKADVILLAVKPGQVNTALQATKNAWTSEKTLVSVAAGISTGVIETIVGQKVPVVRVMPNTPCLINQGVIAICGGKYCREQEIEIVNDMFKTMGIVFKVEEKQMDAVTAVSGSGPAYIYLIIESFINAAVNIGMDHNMAHALVMQTIKGGMEMVEYTGEHPAVLRDQVCSPGGTTIAGVRQLEDNGLRKALYNAVEKAYLRSIELGKI